MAGALKQTGKCVKQSTDGMSSTGDTGDSHSYRTPLKLVISFFDGGKTEPTKMYFQPISK